jgi:hypothetical protein
VQLAAFDLAPKKKRLKKMRGGVAAAGRRASFSGRLAMISPRGRSQTQPAFDLVDVVAFSGWLHKEGDFGVKNSFQRRFFVLKGIELHYFKEDPAAAENASSQGHISLHNASLREPRSPRPGFPHCVRIDLGHPDGHLRNKYVLAADTASLKSVWVAKLGAALDAYGRAVPQPEPAADAAAASMVGVDEDAAMQSEMEAIMMEGAELQVTPCPRPSPQAPASPADAAANRSSAGTCTTRATWRACRGAYSWPRPRHATGSATLQRTRRASPTRTQ